MKRTLLLSSLLLFCSCEDLILGDVSGSFMGQSFDESVAIADRNGDGSYVITIADTPEFACSSTDGLPESYLTVVIDNIRDAPIELSASGVVFFNTFESNVADTESATSGVVTIDSIDAFSIDGQLTANSGTGSVSGSFSAEICN